MNYRGSSRHLLRNSKSAILSAIEIYNKPVFLYREECFVILFLNAWELLLKSIISKNGGSIYYRKKRGQPYRTLSLEDAITKAEKFFPTKIQALPLRANLSLLSTYRDNAVHFYNESNFGVIIYSLCQTSIINFKDLLFDIFGKNLGEEISWHLMPLGIEPPVDPIKYINKEAKSTVPKNAAVKHFISAIASSVKEIEEAGADTGRLMTVFNISLNSIKKIENADFVVGVDGSIGMTSGPLVITKLKDPNTAYPHRQKEIIQKIRSLHGKVFNQHTFQAICYKYGFKDNPYYCWKSSVGDLIKYSNEFIKKIKSLTKEEVDIALDAYSKKPKNVRIK